jgi:exportin-5
VIHAINTRPSLSRNEADDLMSPLLSGDSIALLTQVYSWSILDMDVSDIDEQKYTLCKKTSEVHHL